MKSISQDTLTRLTSIALGNSGSQGEISLRTPDFDELKAASSGATLKELESIDNSSRVVTISVPLLTAAIKAVSPSIFGDPTESLESPAPAPVSAPKKPSKK